MRKATLVFLAALSAAFAWTNHGGDHGDSNWILTSSDTISGYHYNVRMCSLPAGVTTYVYQWDGSDSATGQVWIAAQNIKILGTLDASGRGYGGGGGGQNDEYPYPGGLGGVGGRGGNGAVSTWDSLLEVNSGGGGGGSPFGLPGHGGYQDGDTGRPANGGRGGDAVADLPFGGNTGGGGGPGSGGGGGGGAGHYSGGGGGGGGGTGGQDGNWIFGGAGAGAWGGPGGLGADTLDDSLRDPNPPTCGIDGGYQALASNGDTTTDNRVFRGSGGGGSGSGNGMLAVDSVNGGGGAGGGAGGGLVALVSGDTLIMSGTLSTLGAGGGQAGGFFDTTFGGGGAGGGVLLSGKALNLTGTVDARGRSRQDLTTANGGTLKIFYWTLVNHLTYQCGRYYPRSNAQHDVGITAVAAPTGEVDSGFPVTPNAVAHNYGLQPATFDVEMRISDGYDEVVNCTVNPGSDWICVFPPWTPMSRDTFAVQCSTELSDDADHSNDRTAGQVYAVVHDLAVVNIVYPVGAVPLGMVTPEALLRNRGSQPEDSVSVFFQVPLAGYAESIKLGQPMSGNSDTLIQFPPFNAWSGFYTARCSVGQSLDRWHDNDVAVADYSVDSAGHVDVGVVQIVAPVDSNDSSRAISPAARVRNFGTVPASLEAQFLITDTNGAAAYLADTVIHGLSGGESLLVVFPEWPKPHWPNLYWSACSTYLAGDGNNANDVSRDSFVIYPPPPESAWVRRANLPFGIRNRRVRDGGSLTALDSSDRTDGSGGSEIYCFKGGGTCQFFRYNTATDSWTTIESIPAYGASGKKKGVKKGGSLCNAGGSLYATKGNNTTEFWRYTPAAKEFRDGGVVAAPRFAPGSGLRTRSLPGSGFAAYPWTQMPDVPASTRKVKEGTGMASVTIGDTTWVYLLKGSNTTEFYRFNTLSNAWETCPSAPTGLSGRNWKIGSCIVATTARDHARRTTDSSTLIYALKGAYNEFFTYVVDSTAWKPAPALPFVGNSGKKRKVKAGAALAGLDVSLYVTKGGNTQEFWVYRTDFSRWIQGHDVPLGDGKRVNGGGAVVAARNFIYVLKGNNTNEFWRYNPATGPAEGMPADPAMDVMSNSDLGARDPELRAAPNPFTDATTITLSIPQSAVRRSRSAIPLSLKLYDVTGKLVSTLRTGYCAAGPLSLVLHHESLSRGIYLLKLETGNAAATTKLIME